MGEQPSITKKRIMLIGYDSARESAYHLHLKRKKMYLEQAIELCSKVVEINDIDKFKKNFVRYVIDEVKAKTGLGQIKESELLKLVDVPVQEITKLQQQYDTYNVDLDAPIPSFEIHTTSKEQESSYKALLKLCDELNSFKHPLHPTLQNHFNGAIKLEEGKWVPNPFTILSI